MNPQKSITNTLLDGIIPIQLAYTLSKGSGTIHGIDSSEAMINAAKKAAKNESEAIERVCTFQGELASQYPH